MLDQTIEGRSCHG